MISRRSVLCISSACGALHAQPASKRIGFLSLVPNEMQADTGQAFRKRLEQLGHVIGRDVQLDQRSANGRSEELAKLAELLVGSRPDVLVSGLGTLPAAALKAASSSLPIVFCAVGDPVGAGLVASLSRPGGNVTGLDTQVTSVVGKRLQLARELLPSGRRFAVLMNPGTPATRLSHQELVRTAAMLGVQVQSFELRAKEDLERAFELVRAFAPDLLLILEDPVSISLRHEIAALASRLRLATICGVTTAVEAGCLASYGVSRPAAFARAAEYVDKILRGAQPADLPVEQVATFEFALNRTVARDLRIAIPAAWSVIATKIVGN